MLKRDGWKCVFCGSPVMYDGSYLLDCAHVWGDEHGGSEEEDNLISLCPNCHRMFDAPALSIDPDSCDLIKLKEISGIEDNHFQHYSPQHVCKVVTRGNLSAGHSYRSRG